MTRRHTSPRLRPRFRLQGWFWDLGPLFLPPLRRLRRAISLLRYRWRGRSHASPPHIVPEAARRRPTMPLTHPVIAVHRYSDGDSSAIECFLGDQTETSITTDPATADGASFCVTLGDEPASLPATWLESQLFALVAEGLEWTISGWTPPATDPYGPATDIAGPITTPSPGLVRLPSSDIPDPPLVLGRAVPHITSEERLEAASSHPLESTADVQRSGPYFLRSDVRPGRIVHQPLHSLHDALSQLPAVAGPPTALFLLPFLAVGGAESLLFDLLSGLKDRYRLLIVTVEPHHTELGQTVDEARQLTPFVNTLGDWLPRPAHHDALRHLLRRYTVEVLMSWNGTVFFYDIARELRRSHPKLRLLNQLFNHRGGWIEHYGPRLISSIDLHVAVNRPIASALRDERGVSEERLVMIHHGVRLPDDLPDDARAERKHRARRELGLPQNAVIAGSFMRLHAQKRPFDILRLARRALEQGPSDLHFLLAGGGPLDTEIDRELEQQPLPNLTRLPLQRDVDRLYDAVDLCLLPSAYEGLPVFLLDGLARRIPCVATAVGDVPDLLRDGGGILIEQIGDLDALTGALKALCDPRRRATEGDLGRQTVARRFSIERYVQAYETALFPSREDR